MVTIQTRTAVGPDGTLTVENLPLPPGTKVELTIRAETPESPGEVDYPLRGQKVIYIDPFEPAVPESDWEANQ